MAEQKTLRQHSRTDWTPVDNSDKPRHPTDEEKAIGCFQRIADAMEKMAKPFVDLLKENQDLKESRDYYRDKYRQQERSIPGIRGQVTRYKNKNAALKAEILALSKMVE